MLQDLFIDTLREANTTLMSEIEFLRRENHDLRKRLEMRPSQYFAIPAHLRSRYRAVGCTTAEELKEKIETQRKRTVHVPKVAVEKVAEDQRPVQNELQLIKDLGLETSSTSSSSDVLSLDTSPLASENEDTPPQKTRRAILTEQAYRKPVRISIPERTDRQGHEHSAMSRLAHYLAQPVAPITSLQRCRKCHQRQGHASACRR